MGEVAWPFRDGSSASIEPRLRTGDRISAISRFSSILPPGIWVSWGRGRPTRRPASVPRAWLLVRPLPRAGTQGKRSLQPEISNGAELISESPRSSPADEALEDEIADVVGRAIGGDALRDPGHVFDEIDEIQIEIILD